MEGKGQLCYSTIGVEYLPSVCLIEGCLDYLYTIKYGWIPYVTHRVSAVVVVAVVVVVVSTTAAGQGRADPIGFQANLPGSRGLVGY